MGTTAEINKDRDLDGDQIIPFPWGIPGLEDHREFILNALEEDSPFYYLRSSSRPEIGLLLVNPFLVFSDYEFELDDEAVNQLGITGQNQLAVLCTVNTSRGITSATVNLLAPVVINIERKQAKQVVLNDRRYSYRTPLPFEQVNNKGVR